MLTVAPAREVSFAELRAREFSRLDAKDHVYLDYTGSALYAESQLRAHYELLRDGLFGNPHSDHHGSRASTEAIDDARGLLLRFLDVDERTHDVIFTANTTAAIKLVAESYAFTAETDLVLSVDNHNSINGIREYARRAGARVRYLALDEELRLRDVNLRAARGLLAFPAQSNFSGVRHPLSLVQRAKSLGYDVLLDVASFVPSHALSLRECPADFAALSFYKLFGYPTGIGALVARREALARLRRPWFAGGTVSYVSVHADTHRLRPHHDGFEDGTQNFLGIAALRPGFALLDSIGLPRIASHVKSLAALFLREVAALPHVRVYGPRTMEDRGGTIAFNVLDADGAVVPFSVVEAAATRANLAVRGGCFCNPGAAEVALGLDGARIAGCLAALGSDFSAERYADCVGTAVGAVRVSFGLANNEADVRRAVAFLAETTRDGRPPASRVSVVNHEHSATRRSDSRRGRSSRSDATRPIPRPYRR